MIGGGVGIADHIRIGAGAMIAAGSGVGTNVPAGSTYSGYPAQPHQRTADAVAFLMRSKRVTKALKDAELRLDALEKTLRQRK
jgi:UDP-3-O-[3-hydroxymyristoyl] glucosamine N-acyltransferase